ncbi:MAG: TlpA family protein disulfide reductase [Pleurocapsa sp. SU_196_0]|nr:TlpA family protein disulfide reductase [Pleurocapsa sp. SU_196_0]
MRTDDGSPLPEGWRVLLRTQLGRAKLLRHEIISAHPRRPALANAAWHDVPMELSGGEWVRELALTDFAGRPLLVNFWATWCVPCKVEMPTLDALAALEAGKVTVVAIAQDLQGRKKVVPFFEATGVTNLEPHTDAQNRVWSAIGGTPKLPTTVLYNSEGREVWRVVGGVEWDDAEIAVLLREAG